MIETRATLGLLVCLLLVKMMLAGKRRWMQEACPERTPFVQSLGPGQKLVFGMPRRAYLNCGIRGCHPGDQCDRGRPDLSDMISIGGSELIITSASTSTTASYPLFAIMKVFAQCAMRLVK